MERPATPMIRSVRHGVVSRSGTVCSFCPPSWPAIQLTVVLPVYDEYIAPLVLGGGHERQDVRCNIAGAPSRQRLLKKGQRLSTIGEGSQLDVVKLDSEIGALTFMVASSFTSDAGIIEIYWSPKWFH